MVVAHERAEATDSWADALRFVRATPKLGLKYLRAKWIRSRVLHRFESFVEVPDAKHFLSLLVTHPLFTAIHVLPNIRIRWRRNKDGSAAPEPFSIAADEDDGGVDGTIDEAAGDDDEETDFHAMAAEAESLYLDRQVVSAAIRVRDASLFGGRDREEDGFVRLMLRNSYHDFVLPGSGEEHHVVFEPRLLLHESGVAQIDLVLRAENAPLSVREALAMSWGPEPMFVRSQMSAPLLKGTSWQSIADYSSNEVDAGKPLATIVHANPVSMSELLGIHLDAILTVIRRNFGHWTIYPVAVLDVEECCTPENWKQTHREDLVRLAIRGSVNREVADHAPVPRDLSMAKDHSLYANIGSTVYFQWTGAVPEGVSELDTVLLLEYALLQYMRLFLLEERVARMRLSDRSLRARYKAAVLMFSELRQRDLRSGEAREIVRHVLDEYGAPEIRRTIETALNLSSSAYATVSAERASRRAWWVTIAATLIALLVAVPPLQDLLRAVPTPQPGDPLVLIPLRWLSAQGFWGPWIILGTVLLLVSCLWFISVLWRWRVRRWPSFRRGYKWPTEFEVIDEFSPAALGPHATSLRVNLTAGSVADEDQGLPSSSSTPTAARQESPDTDSRD